MFTSLLDSFCWFATLNQKMFMIYDQTESLISKQQNITMTVIKKENPCNFLLVLATSSWPKSVSLTWNKKKKMRHITGYIPHINHFHHPLLLAVRWLCGVNMSLIYWQRAPPNNSVRTQLHCTYSSTLKTNFTALF